MGVIWGIGLVGCGPLVTTERGRALFERWPTGFDPANYLLVALAVGVAHLLAFVLVAGLLGDVGGDAIFGSILLLNAAFPALCATVVAVLAPRVSDWTPDGRGMHGYSVLLVTTVWYWFVTTVGVTGVIALLVFLEWMGTEAS